MNFEDLLKTKKIIICCGSGGVGKTTLSASLGVKAAQMGLRVLVLTIDPARRLATSLGLKNLNEETRVTPELFSGELYAAMLDMKRIFDEFIMKMAPSREAADKVLNNNIYRQISTALNGSQEFTALERLLQATTSGKYDLVILDTPPTKHAIDFLTAPTRIYALFQDSTMKWFMMPITTLDKMTLGIMNRGTKMAIRAFEKLVGSEFFSTLTDFFMSIRDWQKVLRDRSAEIHRFLTSQATGFILVTGFNAVRIEEARFFEQSLKKGGYPLSAIIVNRAFPLWGGDDQRKDQRSFNGNESNSVPYKKLVEYYRSLKNFYSSQEEAFRNFALEAREKVIFCRLPDFDQDVHDINSLKKISDRLKGTNFPEEEGGGRVKFYLASLVILLTASGCAHKPPPPPPPVPTGVHTSDPAKEKILFDQGYRALSKNDFKQAVQKYSDLVKLYPATHWLPQAEYNLGLSLEGLGKYPEAAEQYKKVVDYYQNGSTRDEAEALYRLSICYEVANDDSKVILALLELQNHTQYLGHDTGEVELPARLAAAYARQGNHEQAASYFSRAEKGLKRMRTLHPKGESLLWLPKTLYSMGHLPPPKKAMNPREFKDYLASLSQTQTWLVQSAEMGDNPWSKKAAEDLINIYFDAWNDIDKHPVADLPDKEQASKLHQDEQKEMAVDFDNSISKLKLERLPSSPLEPENSRLKAVFSNVALLQKQNDALLQESAVQDQPTSESQQREGLKRQGVIKDDSSKSEGKKDLNENR